MYPHFTKEDFIRAFFGSFIVGLAFVFNGVMITYAIRMNWWNMLAVSALTLGLVTLEIYLLSYRFVFHKRNRPFGEFWAKRFFAITVSSFLSVYLICYAYGINNIVASRLELFKVCLAVFLPAATAGGVMEVLKKQF